MNIGNIQLKNPVITAPMAGVTSRAFREILSSFGAGLVTTEMISAKALVYENKQSLELLTLEETRPIVVQLCGHEPEFLARAAVMAEQRGASVIDINCGCPAPKIVKNQDGSRLLAQPKLIETIIREVKKAVSCPVTMKIRKGWEGPQETGLVAAVAGEQGGADAITVHGRYRQQFYTGEADWDFVRRVKEAVSCPVIGNGDLFSGSDCLRMLDQTHCDGIMLGRGLMGNPWLVREALAVLAGENPPSVSAEERFAVAKRHLAREVELMGEYIGVREMRKHLAWYIKGMPKAAVFRNLLNSKETFDQVETALLEYETMVRRYQGIEEKEIFKS